jgi:Flp pilus assembly protein TadG
MIFRTYNKKRKAQQMVEFILVAPILLVMLISIIEFGYAITVKNNLAIEIKNSIVSIPKSDILNNNLTLTEKTEQLRTFVANDVVSYLIKAGITNSPKGSYNSDIDVQVTPTTGQNVLVSVTYYYRPMLLDAILPLIGGSGKNKSSFALNTTEIINLNMLTQNYFDSGLTTEQLSKFYHVNLTDDLPPAKGTDNSMNRQYTTAYLVAWGSDNSITPSQPYFYPYSVDLPRYARLYSESGTDLLPANLFVDITTATLVVITPYYYGAGDNGFLNTGIPYVYVVSALGFSNVLYTKHNATFGNDSDVAWVDAGGEPLYETNAYPVANPDTGSPFKAPMEIYTANRTAYYRTSGLNYSLYNNGDIYTYFQLDLQAQRSAEYLASLITSGAYTSFDFSSLPDLTTAFFGMAAMCGADFDCINACVFFRDHPDEATKLDNAGAGNIIDLNDRRIAMFDLQRYMDSHKFVNNIALALFNRSNGYRWMGAFEPYSYIYYATVPEINVLEGSGTINEYALKHRIKSGWRGLTNGYNFNGFTNLGYTIGNSENLRIVSGSIDDYSDYMRNYTTYRTTSGLSNLSNGLSNATQSIKISQPIVPFYSSGGDTIINGREIDPDLFSNPAGPFYDAFRWNLVLDADTGIYDRTGATTPTNAKNITLADVYLDTDSDGIPDAWDDNPQFFDIDANGLFDGHDSNIMLACPHTTQGSHYIYTCNETDPPRYTAIDRVRDYNHPVWGVAPLINPPFVCRYDLPDDPLPGTVAICNMNKYLSTSETYIPPDLNNPINKFVRDNINGALYMILEESGTRYITRVVKTWSADATIKSRQQTYFANVYRLDNNNIQENANSDTWFHTMHSSRYAFSSIPGTYPRGILAPTYWDGASPSVRVTANDGLGTNWTILKVDNYIPPWGTKVVH